MTAHVAKKIRVWYCPNCHAENKPWYRQCFCGMMRDEDPGSVKWDTKVELRKEKPNAQTRLKL